jgi:YHS domain-containing protein
MVERSKLMEYPVCEGKDYHFCCKACKKEFEAEQTQYIKK